MQVAAASEVRAFPGGHGDVFGSTDADGFPIVLQGALEEAYRIQGIGGNGSDTYVAPARSNSAPA